ncbi:MAG: septation protein SpoVG family protein [Candidatus Omnitrophica bacterium]|nr:septation protein SpoVG family protein [Candidatus Omnitrophota bacterium]
MEITEVRISLRDGGNRKLKAYATITFDDAFVVRNVKVIEGNKGLFVAMPSRKLRESCPKCNYKNAVRSKFCNQCGSSLPQIERKPQVESSGPQQSDHRDIAHPITLECREYIQKKVLESYEGERKNPSSAPPAGGHKTTAAATAPTPVAAATAPTPIAAAPKVEEHTEEHSIEDDVTEGGDIEL